MGVLRTLMKRVAYWPEIPCAFYLFALMFYGPISEQYLYKYYSDEVGYNYTINSNGKSGDCPTGQTDNSTNAILQKEVQKKVSQFLSKQSFFQNIPGMVLCLFYGPLSDRFGRKPILLVGYGSGLLNFVLCTVVVFIKCDVRVLFLGSFIVGLGGFFQAAILAISAYLCDLVEGKKRAMRLAIIELLMFFCIMISNFTGGVFLQTFGFQVSFIFMTVLTAMSVLSTIFILKESLLKEKRIKLKSYRYLFINVFRTVFKSRPKRLKLLVLVLIVILSFIPAPNAMLGTILLYLINKPLCWSPSQIGYYRGSYFMVLGIGAVLGTKVLPAIMRIPFVLILSFLSSAGFYVALGFSHSTLTLYLSLFATIFVAVSNPVLKGHMSMLVTDKELGSLFAFLASAQSLLMFGSTYMFQKLYQVLNESNIPGYTFFWAAMLNILPIMGVFVYMFKVQDHYDDYPTDDVFREDNNDPTTKSIDENKPLLET